MTRRGSTVRTIGLAGITALLLSGAASAEGKLSFSLWQYSEPPIGDWWQQVVAGFEAETGVTVEIRNTPTAQYYQQLVIEVSNGAAADVIMMGTHHFAEYAASGNILALDEFVTSSGIRGNIAEGGWNALSVGNVVYGLPIAGRTLEIIYNECHFKEAGVAAPPTSPEEWLAAARALVVKDEAGNVKRYGASMMNANEDPTYEMLLMWTLAFGGQFATPTGEWTVDSPEVVKALSFMKTMYDEELVPRGLTEADQRSLFATGRTSMTIDGQWQFPFIQENNPDNYDCYKSALHPWKGPTTGGTNTALAVNANAENRDLALKFIEYVSRPETMRTFGDFSPTIPLGVDALTEKQIASRPYIHPWLESIGTAISYAPPGHADEMSQVWPIIVDAVIRTLQSGMPAEESLAKAQADLKNCCQ